MQWWRDSGVLQRGMAGREGGPDFIFFEGPPTANGRPGVHHVLARAFKDIILRYKRMRGFHLVGARGGWDTQGLPVEVEVEKELEPQRQARHRALRHRRLQRKMPGQRLPLRAGLGEDDRPHRLLGRPRRPVHHLYQ